ncbi:MAG: hypothetical protein AAF430_05355 [Myxococcota bacterium]
MNLMRPIDVVVVAMAWLAGAVNLPKKSEYLHRGMNGEKVRVHVPVVYLAKPLDPAMPGFAMIVALPVVGPASP